MKGACLSVRSRRLVAPFLIAALVCGAAILAACGGQAEEAWPEPVAFDLDRIEARDTLVVLAAYNSTGYFLYRGEPMGFEYDLLRRFAEDQDLALRVRVVSDRDSLFRMLNRGEGDVVAARLVPHPSDTARVVFTRALYETPPSLVQQSTPDATAGVPDSVDSLLFPDASLDTTVELQARLIRRPGELAGDTVSLRPRSPYTETLVELADSISGDIEVVEVESARSVETLIRRVARGGVALTVAPNNLAELKQDYYGNIAVKPLLGEPLAVAWAVRPNAPLLRQALNTWIEAQEGSADFNTLYQKYFVDRRGYQERIESEYLTTETGKLSPFDELFQTAAERLGWDWRLFAAQAYQESRFKPRARSWAGAAGLMQLMPATARQFGVDDRYAPEDNVEGAARFLDWLAEYWAGEIADEQERLKFVLASYNAGQGHVQDARRLAAKYGDDDTQWEDVAYWLLQKSKRKYYTDPAVRYGFCRGLEPVTYVARILERYDHYRELVDSDVTAA